MPSLARAEQDTSALRASAFLRHAGRLLDEDQLPQAQQWPAAVELSVKDRWTHASVAAGRVRQTER